ncbi:MAG: bile acid:sodium symporter family protein [Rhizomicrobium sp.]
MASLRAALSRLPIDLYLLALSATVGLGLLLPATGAAMHLVNGAAYVVVFGLFFLYGARLAPQVAWRGLTHWRLQSLVLASTFILFPVLGLVFSRLVGHLLAPDLVLGLIFLCLLPSTVQSSIAFTSIARGNVPAAICAASVSNVIGVILTPLLAAQFLAGHQGLTFGSLGAVAMQILLPFAVGQAARPFLGQFLNRHPVVTSLFDRGCILVIVYSAFSAGTAAHIWNMISAEGLATIAGLALLLLAMVIAATTVISRKLGFSKEDEIAIVFCGSKKSMASGLPMARILFSGHALGLVVLPLMIFHPTQLFVCAALAKRYAGRDKGRETAESGSMAAPLPAAPSGEAS